MDADWRPLYPFKSRYVDVGGGVRCHYVDEGRGRPVLLCHGNPTWSFLWRRVIQEIRPFRRAIAMDHVGCGLSDKPADYPYCLARHIDNLTTLIERLDLREITLAAHDWGGPIGLGAAVRQPDRFASLVLFNTGAFPPPRIPWPLRMARSPVIGRFAVQGLNAFVRGALRWATARPEGWSPAVRAGYLAPYDCWAHRVAVYQFLRDIPASDRHPTWSELAAIQHGLAQLSDRPALFLWGMRDWVFDGPCLQRMQELLPQAVARPFPEAGHLVLEDAWDALRPVLRAFLEQEDPSRD